MVTIKRTHSPVSVGCTEPRANCTVYELQATSCKLQRGEVRYLADSSVAAIRLLCRRWNGAVRLELSAPYAVGTGGGA